MQSQENKTRMTAPQQSSGAKVKIELLQACEIDGKILNAGTKIDVDDEVAKEFCDRSFDGYLNHNGEVDERNASKAKIFRAKRI